MKKLSILLFVTGVLASGCKKDPPAPEGPYVRFGQSSLQLAPTPGAEATLTVESNIAWKLKIGEEVDALLDIDKKQGSGNTTIHLKTQNNATTEKTVTIKAVAADKPDEILATMTVTQKPYNPQIEITSYLGGSKDDYANAVIATADGGVIVAGHIYSSKSGQVIGDNHSADLADFWIVKLNASNDIVWQKILGGSKDDYATGICKTTDGSYVVAGSTRSHNSGDVGANNSGTDNNSSDFWLVKFAENADKKGINIAWDTTVGTAADEIATAIAATPDNGIVVTGRTHNNGAATGDFYTAKVKSDGTIAWKTQTGGATAENAYGIAAAQDGCMVAGYQISNGNAIAKFLRYNDQGVITKSTDILNGNHTGAKSIIAIPDGFLAVGSAQRTIDGNTSEDCAVFTINADGGSCSIVAQLGGAGYDEAMSIVPTNDGGYAIAGYTASSHTGDVTDNNIGIEDYWIVKLNSSFQKLWDKSFGTSGKDIANGIAATTDGKYVVAGYSPAASKGNDYGILKIKDH